MINSVVAVVTCFMVWVHGLGLESGVGFLQFYNDEGVRITEDEV